MKKLKYLIILMFSILIITSCGEITQPCNHVKSDWIIDKEATCIGSYAFYNCTSLTSIEIPTSVTKIKYRAFASCRALNNIYYKGTLTQWNEISKDTNWNWDAPLNCKVICLDGTCYL